MQYPRGFPQEAEAPVVRAELEARRHLKERGADQAKFRKYVLRVFLAFAQEACKLGMAGKWGVEKIRSGAHYFLYTFWSEAYEEFRKRLVIRQPCYRPSWSDLEWEFGRSEEWRQFEKELLAVAEAQSAGTGTPQPQGIVQPLFTHSDSYQKISFRGIDYDLTRHRSAAKVLRVIHEEHKRGAQTVTIDEIRSGIGLKQGGSMYDWFRGTDLWKHLVIEVERGVYRLDIHGNG